MWLLNLWSIWRRRKQVRLGLWSWEIHIQALEYLSDAQFDGQGRRESAGKPPQDCPGQWEKSQQAASKLHNCSRKFCFGISVLQPANKWQAQQWIRFNHPHCPASGSQSSGRAGIFHARFIPAFFVPEGWDKQQVPHTNVSWLISFSFVHLMWMMMTMMMVVVVVVMPVPKPLVWRQ